MSRACTSLIAPVAVVALLALFAVCPRAVRAQDCGKPDGKQCQTNISCCSRNCMKPTVSHGAALFGICCTPTTCAAEGKNCGTIPNGDCTGFTLDCGTCTAPETCGGGGTANVCGTICTLTCLAGNPGGTLNPDCTCTCPNTCLNGGTLNRDCSCTCPSGYDSDHGGCFHVNNSFGNCGSSCEGTDGSVDGSGNFLCVNENPNSACSSNSQCPLGSACLLNGHNFCVAQCTSP